VVSCWVVATGTTIRALTSSRPTTLMATVTVTAAPTATSRLRKRTGKPETRATSSSWHTANSSRANTATVTSTVTESATMT
jgi:hypothetical protein